jgi:hypothetical protein
MTAGERMTDRVKLPDDVRAALNSSGFPFQTAVAHVVRAVPGWSVSASEYVWQTRDGETHFLDLVVTNGTMYLTIECKKTSKRSFTFLRPLGAHKSGLTAQVRSLRAVNVNDSGRRVEIRCEDWQLYPRSHTSEFCVVTNADPSVRLLERDAAELVQATDAFALSLKEPRREMGDSALIVPIIVTNAPLYTARYDPRLISLSSGDFAEPPDDITQPECVRFHKSFPSDSLHDLGARTVLVVSAACLGETLGLLAPTPDQPGEGQRNGVFLHRANRARSL